MSLTQSLIYRLYLNSKNSTAIRGLSNFTINYVNAQAKSMSASIVLFFEHIEAEGPYNLDGFYLKKYMPTYGNGLIKYVGVGIQSVPSLSKRGTYNLLCL